MILQRKLCRRSDCQSAGVCQAFIADAHVRMTELAGDLRDPRSSTENYSRGKETLKEIRKRAEQDGCPNIDTLERPW